MGRGNSKPPPVRNGNEEPKDWYYVIEAIEPSILGRYRVYLVVDLFMVYGHNNGWGWGCWTAKGAKRKAERELRRYRAKQAKRNLRQTKIEEDWK